MRVGVREYGCGVSFLTNVVVVVVEGGEVVDGEVVDGEVVHCGLSLDTVSLSAISISNLYRNSVGSLIDCLRTKAGACG